MEGVVTTKGFRAHEPEECEEGGGAPDCRGNECHLVSLVGTSATALRMVIPLFQLHIRLTDCC